MTFEEALRLRAGSLGIKAPWRARRRASTGAHGPIASSCDRDVERALPRGRWGSQGTPGSRMFCDPQTAFGLGVLGLLCVAVFYLALGATHSASSCSIAATVSSTAEPSIAAAMIRLSDSGAVSSTWRNSSFIPGYSPV